ncbi:MAG: chromosome segregation protein SMC [Candidatus Heimdallarchaeota archaeon]|nr:chromosome segregation protein SMC [Candidatus Heimdallarchaeota archaeon]
MVHIKEIKMTGWKSYGPGTVRMPLATGFTVIVGPNGSGKSNSIDGINFCLGAMSKKSMRADKMIGLIYNGIGGKKPADKATVEIIFDNSDFLIPLKEKEIIVSRELKRNGSSTYRLNGKRTTRTDILDKLRIAGIDVINSYNIIAQGQVGEIVGMNPIERRKLMENLAGVGQFDEKKQSALVELDEANRRMDELQLLVSEVSKRVESLRKEKDDAEHWTQLDNEVKKLKALLISFAFHKNSEGIKKFDDEISEFRTNQEALITERDGKTANIDETTEKIRNLEDQTIRLETSLKEIRSNIEEKNIEKAKIDEKTEYNNKTLQTNENRMKQLEERLIQIEKKKEEDLQTKSQLEEGKRELIAKIEETQTQKSSVEKDLEAKNEEYDDIKNEYDDAERRYRIENDRLTKTQVSFEVSQNMVTAFQNNVNEYEKRQKELDEQININQTKLNELKQIIEEDTTKTSETQQRMEEIQEKKQNIENTILTLDSETRQLNDQYIVKKARIDTISSFLKAESGKENPAVSFISEKANSGEISGVLGEFQNISREGETLPSEVGHLSDAIITDTIDTAIFCIKMLKENAIGAANFIPLEQFKLKLEDKFSNIVKKIKEQNEIIDNLNEAVNIWRKGKQTVTTTDGDVFYSNGIIFGGFHLVSAQETINQLIIERDETEEKLNLKKNELKEVQTSLKKLNDLENVIVKSLEKLEKNIQNNTIALNQQENEIKLYRENIEKNKGEIKPLLQQLADRTRSRDEQEQEMHQYEKTIEEIAQEMNEIETRLEAADTRPLLEQMNQIEQKLGKLQGRLTGIDSRIESLTKSKEEREARILETQEEINALKVENANLEGELEAISEQKEQIGIQLKQILEKEDSITDEMKEVKSDLSTQKKYQGQLVKDKERLNEKITQLEEKITSIKLQRERFSVEIENLQNEAVANNIEILSADAEELKKIKESKITEDIESKSAEKKRLEPVNMRALKEFQEENSRYIELLDRRDILIEERQVILDFIEDIETEKYTVFMKTFRSVNKHFGSIFNELSGGDARLILEKDPKKGEDIFEGGLFIEAHPAGKRVASLEAMSGGEKALTALAFIFAVQTVDVQPFYILDEIDAALDPMNVRRVAKLLHRMSRSVGQDEGDEDQRKKKSTPGAQFLVISHRDILMAWADRLYGCTNVKGLSSIFSIQMSEDKQLERATSF